MKSAWAWYQVGVLRSAATGFGIKKDKETLRSCLDQTVLPDVFYREQESRIKKQREPAVSFASKLVIWACSWEWEQRRVEGNDMMGFKMLGMLCESAKI